MKALVPRRAVLSAALLAAATLGACARAPVVHDPLAGVEPLRTHFNERVAHTRIVMLAAPT